MVPILDQSEVPTRFLIISDTYDSVSPCPPASLPNGIDVLIHCGNLTYDSTLDEFTTALDLLSSLNTVPLKLIIPGPHDWTLDDAAYEARITEATTNTNKKKGGGTGIPLPRDMEALYAEYGRPGQARQLLLSDKARQHGIFLMVDEGRWEFALANHAVLNVYASPWTLALPKPRGDLDGDGEGSGSGTGSGTGTGNKTAGNGTAGAGTGTGTGGNGTSGAGDGTAGAGNGTPGTVEKGKGKETELGFGHGGGFQYTKAQGHPPFDIRYTANVVITHGPPLAILDYYIPVRASSIFASEEEKEEGKGKGQQVGCPDLFAAVAMCRPKLHCFGNTVYAGWGARLAQWRDGLTRDGVDGRPMMASHLTDIDHEESITIDISGMWRVGTWTGMKKEKEKGKGNSNGQVRDITDLDKRIDETENTKDGGLCRIYTDRHYEHCVEMRLRPRRNTLFFNAALGLPVEDKRGPWPWPLVVEIELPKQRSHFS